MKSFKTIFFVTTMLLIAVHTGAQEKKTAFGVKVGLNLADITPIGEDETEFENTSTQTGFHVGLTLDYAFTANWYLATGLEYTNKGTIIDLTGGDMDIKAAYVQLPLCGGYKFPIKEDLHMRVQLGPYFAYGLHGKSKYGSTTYETFGKEITKNFDSGIVFNVAIGWKQYYFALGGESGLMNIMQESNSKAATQNTTISIGYKF